MTSFDELVGDVPAEDRERLQSMHSLLVEAGPPPEIPPELSSGPTLAMTLGRVARIRRRRYRPALLVPAIAASLVLALIVGGILTTRNSDITAIALRGTINAPDATGTLDVLPAALGKQPMRIDVKGLGAGRYVVYLIRDGHRDGTCGTFTVTTPGADTVASLTSPYKARAGDRWIVTRASAGTTVLRPTA